MMMVMATPLAKGYENIIREELEIEIGTNIINTR